MFRKLVAAFVTILFAASLHTTVFAESIHVGGDGNFKTGEVICQTGVGFPPRNWDENDSFAKTFARQVARMDALRKLVESIDGVNIDFDESGYLTDHRISQDSKAFKLLEKNARVIDVKFLEKGICEVTMEVVFPIDWHK